MLGVISEYRSRGRRGGEWCSSSLVSSPPRPPCLLQGATLEPIIASSVLQGCRQNQPIYLGSIKPSHREAKPQRHAFLNTPTTNIAASVCWTRCARLHTPEWLANHTSGSEARANSGGTQRPRVASVSRPVSVDRPTPGKRCNGICAEQNADATDRQPCGK